MFLPRLVGFYIKSLCIYLGNLGKNIDENKTSKVAPFAPYFTKNKKYYVYNSIQILKDYYYTFKVRRHPLFIAAYVIIITIRFTYVTDNRFTSQSSLLSIWP